MIPIGQASPRAVGLDLPTMRRDLAEELERRRAAGEPLPRFEEVWRRSPSAMKRSAFWGLVWVPAHDMAGLSPVDHGWQDSVARDLDKEAQVAEPKRPTIIRHRGFEAVELADGRWRVHAVVSGRLMADCLKYHTDHHQKERDGVQTEVPEGG